MSNNKTNKILYWAATGLLSAFMVFSATMYFIEFELVAENFQKLGYPTYIIRPLAVAKILAVVAILSKKSILLKEWAYAGLFFDFVLALYSHLMMQDGDHLLAIIAIVLLVVSYGYDRKLYVEVTS